MPAPARKPQATATQHAAVSLFLAGVEAVKPDNAVMNSCRVEAETLFIRDRQFPLNQYRHIYVVGAGKATAPMAAALERILGARITTGIIVVKYGHTEPLARIRTIEAAHPIPDDAGANGARQVLELVSAATADDLVICLISGGGSSLLPLPAAGLTLEDKQKTTAALLASGATIHEVNTVRKHLSALKGGLLARAASPATLISLIISDVIGDDLDTIASGPTVADSTTFADCDAIIRKYRLNTTLPPRVLDRLDQGLAGSLAETAKPEERCFTTALTTILAGNLEAVQRVEYAARQQGYNTLILSSMLEGESREIAKSLVAIARECSQSGLPVAPPACIIAGGETTVTIRGGGKGGRNQEMALSAAIALESLPITFLSCGTDGNDGPTEAAGAVVDGTTLNVAKSLQLDPIHYLNDNDSYHFLKKTGNLVITGPTNTNVMDLQIMLVPAG
ncbi:MAG: glycerate kinase [Desulfopila sp.]